MPLNRSEAVLALTNLLDNKISESQVYEWALAYAVSGEFETIVSDDPLLREVIQVLMDMSNQGAAFVPTKDDLIYYKKCLEGEADFEPLASRLEKIKKARRAIVEQVQQQKKELLVAKPKTLSRKIMRIYVILFALTSLAVNAAGIVKPGLFRPDEIISRGQAFKEAFPHFIYVAVLLTPVQTVIRGVLYYLALPTLFLGTIFYFYITVSIVLQLKLNPLMILAFAPFALIPALFSLWLLLTEKKD